MRRSDSIIRLLLLVGVIHFCSTRRVAAVEGNLYPFGTEAGDVTLERSDEGSSSMVEISTAFPFFGSTETIAYVSLFIVD